MDYESTVSRAYCPETQIFTVVEVGETYTYKLADVVPHHLANPIIVNDLTSTTPFVINNAAFIIYAHQLLIIFDRQSDSVVTQQISHALNNPTVVIGHHTIVAYADNIIYARLLKVPHDPQFDVQHERIPDEFEIIQASPIDLALYIRVLKHRITGDVIVGCKSSTQKIDKTRAFVNTIWYKINDYKPGVFYSGYEGGLCGYAGDHVIIPDCRAIHPKDMPALYGA